jgi:hypothetical protein
MSTLLLSEGVGLTPHSTKTWCYGGPDLDQQANLQILVIGKRGSKLPATMQGRFW